MSIQPLASWALGASHADAARERVLLEDLHLGTAKGMARGPRTDPRCPRCSMGTIGGGGDGVSFEATPKK